MRIVIPTLGRVGNQKALATLPPRWKKKASLLVEPQEEHLHDEGVPLIVLPEGGRGVAWARQWLTMHVGRTLGEKHLLMMDDDLRFRCRDGAARLRPADQEAVGRMCDWLQGALQKGYPLAGVSAAGGNNRVPAKCRVATRQTAVHAINVQAAVFQKWRWDRVPAMEDFDFTLQVFRSGRPNVVTFEYAWDQKSHAEGGCSTHRTLRTQSLAAHYLAKAHHPFVQVVTKKAWQGMGGEYQHDVRVQWRKAYEDGKSKRASRPSRVAYGGKG